MEEDKKPKWYGVVPNLVAPVPALVLTLLTRNRDSAAPTPTTPAIRTVSPTLPTTLGVPGTPPYWESWWKPSERLATPSADHAWDQFFWFGIVKSKTTPPTPPELCPSFANGANSEYHDELEIRGLGPSLFAWPLKPEYAKAIWEFRHDTSSVAKLTSPTSYGGHDRIVDFIHSQQAGAEASRKEAVAKLASTSDPAVRAKFEAQKAAAETILSTSADEKISGAAEDNLCHKLWYSGSPFPATSYDEACAPIVAISDFAKKICDAYRSFTAGPAKEGHPNAVVTYDDTFSYGVGFALNMLDFITGALVGKASASMPVAYNPAIDDMRTYLRKGGVDFDDAAPAGFIRRLRLAHVEKRGTSYVGWVLTDADAFSAIKHDIHVCDVWASMGRNPAAPGGASQYVQHALIFLQAWACYESWRSIPQLTHAATSAAFAYLCHAKHSFPVSVANAASRIPAGAPSLAIDVQMAHEIMRQIVLYFYKSKNELVWEAWKTWYVHVKLYTNFFHELRAEGITQTVSYPFILLSDYARSNQRAGESPQDAMARARRERIVLTKSAKAKALPGFFDASEDVPDGEWVVDA